MVWKFEGNYIHGKHTIWRKIGTKITATATPAANSAATLETKMTMRLNHKGGNE